MLIAAIVVLLFLSLLWWRFGMPGRPKRATPAMEAAADPAETEA